VRRARRRRELALEGVDFRPEHEPAALDDAVDCGSNVHRIVAGHQRQKRDAGLP
jgi:hypothetical protein